MSARSALVLAGGGLLGLLLSSGPCAGDDEASRKGSVAGEVRVERVVLDATVTSARGDPIPGLGPADFRLRVDGHDVPLESAEWIPAEKPEIPPEAVEAVEAGDAAPEALEAAPGRLIVIFFQTDFTRMRLGGQMRMANELWRFLDELLPSDRVAVLSYDSHLKLRQDFTADRGLIDRAVFASFRIGRVDPVPPGPVPSLARHLDFEAARKAYTVEKGLDVAARALAAFPGAKTMLYFGWGLRVDRTPREGRDYVDALRALYAARVTIEMLDISDADWHTLEGEMMLMADLTGGTYQKTHVFTLAALHNLVRRLSGRYVLVFARPDLPRGAHLLDVRLTGRKGHVDTRLFYED